MEVRVLSWAPRFKKVGNAGLFHFQAQEAKRLRALREDSKGRACKRGRGRARVTESSPGHHGLKRSAMPAFFIFRPSKQSACALHSRLKTSSKPERRRHTLLLTRRDTQRLRDPAPPGHNPPLPFDDLLSRSHRHTKIMRDGKRQFEIHRVVRLANIELQSVRIGGRIHIERRRQRPALVGHQQKTVVAQMVVGIRHQLPANLRFADWLTFDLKLPITFWLLSISIHLLHLQNMHGNSSNIPREYH
ncbi:hypothetical protein [Paraburkholderia rhizosphaerae]|uniref:hypothetical protein n=1 Tax=Paraburkholderia rhizosphaerae TaxID=480658 RepID=UPI003C7E3F15